MSSFMFRRVVQAAFSLCVLATHQYALAVAPTCVTTAAQLQAALTSAANDHQANTIALTVGIYSFSTPLQVNVNDGFALTIEGGYTTADCSGIPTAVPDNTVISGVSASGAYVRIIGDGGLTVRNLTFSGFKPAAGTNAILFADNDGGSIVHIQNTATTGNGVNGISDHILAIFPTGGLLFDDNIVHDNAIANASVFVSNQYPTLPLTLANNTIAGNHGPGLSLNAYSEYPTRLYNNILWNNASDDLILTNCYALALNNTWLNSSIDASSGLVGQSANNSSADPKLLATYRLNTNSPAINTGLPAPMVLPLTDAAENLRVQGSAPDQGAYETSTNDLGAAHTFTVTSANDSGVLTLRQAITDANASGAPARIIIHIGNSCGPQDILLDTPLPTIKVSMLIDGYAQPGSTANTAAPSLAGEVLFNANTCIFLAGTGVPNPGYGFRVDPAADPSVHLEVRGIAFTLFATAAIDIAGGNGSWVHGNAFGETTSGTSFPNNIGIQLDGGTASVVGGPLTADANLIGNNHVTDGFGILLASGEHFATIYNNNIGGNASGGGTGNQNAGIQIQSTSQHLIQKNWIVANGGDGIRMDGSSLILVQSNVIGSITPGLGNGGAGVHILDGTSEVWVGTTIPALPQSAGGNTIAGNGGPGVWIDTDAGTYDQATGNSIYNNTGLAIDLAALGPSANNGSESTGPNHLLHKPFLTGAVNAASGNIAITGSIATTSPNTYRYVTVYASGRCGDAGTRLGNYIVQAAANGTLSLNLNVPAPSFSPAYITATDDDYTAGVNDTSELSNSKRLALSDDLFNDTFDCY